MDKIRPYLKMMRLTHQATALVAVLFGALDSGYLKNTHLTFIATGFYLISVSSFTVNEFVDAADTDKFSVRERAVAGITISKNIVVSLWFLTALIGSLILFNFGLYWQAIASVLAGIIYSVPPFRFKARFLLDQMTVFFYLMFIPYSVGFTLTNQPFSAMITLPFISLTTFLTVAQGVHLLGDLDADKKGGLNNTPVVLGYSNMMKGLIVCAFIATAGFMYLLYQHTHWWYYPLIFFSVLSILALGYARGNIYNPDKLTARLAWATKTAVSLGNWVIVYLAAIIYLLTHQ
jgi:hypothetical protein